MSASQGPWTFDQLNRLLLVNGAAAALCVASWYLVSGEAQLARQLAQLSLGIGGLVLAAAANLSWLLRGHWAVTVRTRRLLGRPEPSRAAAAGAVPTAGAGPVEVPRADGAPVGGEGLTRFHRPDCPLAEGRDWPAMPVAAHRQAGRRPCGICRP